MSEKMTFVEEIWKDRMANPLKWACHDYCDALSKIERGDIDAEDERIEAHNTIEELTGDRFEPILHNLDVHGIYNGKEYAWPKLHAIILEIIEKRENNE